jgi:hypothetical protein
MIEHPLSIAWPIFSAAFGFCAAGPIFQLPVGWAFSVTHLKGNGLFPNARESADVISIGGRLRRLPFWQTVEC